MLYFLAIRFKTLMNRTYGSHPSRRPSADNQATLADFSRHSVVFHGWHSNSLEI